MDLLPSDDERDIADTVAALVSRELPLSALHEETDPSAAPVTGEGWAAFAESGLLGLGLSDEDGGVGLGAVAEVMAFRELGRRLAPGPFLSSVIGAHVAAASGRPDIVGQIVSGETSVSLLATRAEAGADGELSGVVSIIDGPGTSLALLLTSTTAALYSRDAFAGGSNVDCIDPGVRLARAEVDRIRPEILSPEPAAAYERGTLLLSAFLVGISEAVTTAATEHAITREQFGRPIGVNQAVKHACANMAVSTEAARSQLFYAAAAAEAEWSDAAEQISVARVIASDAAIANAQANIQVHGGMGYTAEHDAHLFVKRARMLAPLLGARRAHLDVILQKERSA